MNWSSSIEVEADGFSTVHVSAFGGTFDVSGTLTLTPTGTEPEPPLRWPDATTTGVRRSTRVVTAPVHPGDTISGNTYTVNAANAVYEGLEFYHLLVVVRAPSARFVDCRFSGLDTVPPGSTALLSVRDDRPANGPVPSATAEHCTFRPRRTGVLHDAVRGSNITIRRGDLSGVVDGVHIFGSTAANDPWAGHVLIEDCFMHDFITVPDPGQAATGGKSHNDSVQVPGGRLITVRRTWCDSPRMASIMLTPSRNNTSDITIEDCYIGVSQAGINVNCSRNPSGPIRNLIIRDNVFARQPLPMTITRRTLDIATITGNVWEDGSQPPPAVRIG